MSEKMTCHYCQKTIKNGRWIGTWHFCVSSEERRQIDYDMAMARWSLKEQRRIVASGPVDWGLEAQKYTSGEGTA